MDSKLVSKTTDWFTWFTCHTSDYGNKYAGILGAQIWEDLLNNSYSWYDQCVLSFISHSLVRSITPNMNYSPSLCASCKSVEYFSCNKQTPGWWLNHIDQGQIYRWMWKTNGFECSFISLTKYCLLKFSYENNVFHLLNRVYSRSVTPRWGRHMQLTFDRAFINLLKALKSSSCCGSQLRIFLYNLNSSYAFDKHYSKISVSSGSMLHYSNHSC